MLRAKTWLVPASSDAVDVDGTGQEATQSHRDAQYLSTLCGQRKVHCVMPELVIKDN